jgi:hypothetical protein
MGRGCPLRPLIAVAIRSAARPKLPPTAPEVATSALCSRLEPALDSFWMLWSATASAALSALVVATPIALVAVSGNARPNRRAERPTPGAPASLRLRAMQ